jgi:hypothetical protein
MKSFGDFLEEDKKEDPPAVLVLKRKSIRQFGDGRKVALYYIDKLDKYVTIPYSSKDIQLTTEDIEMEVVQEGNETVIVVRQIG